MSDSCPKCHGRLYGPHYEPAELGGLDWLVYHCACGYSERRPPKDRANVDGADLVRRFLSAKEPK